MFRSTDNGLNWTSVSTGLTNGQVTNLLAVDTNLFAGTGGGVFRSSDNGANWDSVNTGLSVKWVNVLAAKDTISLPVPGVVAYFDQPIMELTGILLDYYHIVSLPSRSLIQLFLQALTTVYSFQQITD